MAFYQLLLLLPALAFADDCRPVDYRKELGPPRDQGDASWCYAFAAADLVTQATKVRVSPYDLATSTMLGDINKLKSNAQVATFLTENPELLKNIGIGRREDPAAKLPHNFLDVDRGIFSVGGWEDQAVLFANVKGLCLDEKLPEQLMLEDFLKTIREAAWKELELACKENRQAPPISEIKNNFTRIMAHLFQSWIDDKCQPRVKFDKPILPRTLLQASSVRKYRMKFPKKAQMEASRRVVFRNINEALDQGKVLSIGFSANEITDPDEDEKDKHGDHAAVIAARKKINGVCHYFLRNSFGKDCDYKKKFQSRCEKNEGGIWIKETDLTTVYSVTTVR